jgi:ribosomal protein S18 acetylase RimI-like enzyme
LTVSVRLAEIDEAPVVREIMLLAYKEYEDTLPVTSGAHTETVEDVVADMEKGGAVLASEDGRFVGSARFRPEDTHLYVGRLAVLPSHRRRGVATAIMRFIEDHARTIGRDAIRLGVRDSLPSNVGLYKALGYEVASIGEHPRGPDRVWWMLKRL